MFYETSQALRIIEKSFCLSCRIKKYLAFPVPNIIQTLRNPTFLSIGHNLDGKISEAKLRDLDSRSGAAGHSTPEP